MTSNDFQHSFFYWSVSDTQRVVNYSLSFWKDIASSAENKMYLQSHIFIFIVNIHSLKKKRPNHLKKKTLPREITFCSPGM